jgi:hypothetical protein
MDGLITVLAYIGSNMSSMHKPSIKQAPDIDYYFLMDILAIPITHFLSIALTIGLFLSACLHTQHMTFSLWMLESLDLMQYIMGKRWIVRLGNLMGSLISTRITSGLC